jgi:hypothetical protein
MTISAHEESIPQIAMPADRMNGIYGLPVVGRPACKVREFYDGMEPQPEDSAGVTFGKNAIRYGTVAAAGVAGTAAAAVMCL